MDVQKKNELLSAVRELKIAELDDASIIESLKNQYTPSEIQMGLNELRYMQVGGVGAVGANSHSGLSSDGVSEIIRKRTKVALQSLIILGICFAIVGWQLWNEEPEATKSSVILPVVIVASIVLPFFLVSYAINLRNISTLRPSYRRWNKIIYLHGSKIGVAAATYSTISNTLKFLNPMYGFKNPGAKSRTSLLFDIGISASVGVSAYNNIEPAKYIELYFQEQSTRP